MSYRGQRKVLAIQARKKRGKAPPKNRMRPDERNSSKKGSFEEDGATEGSRNLSLQQQQHGDQYKDEDDDEEEEILGSDDEEQEDPADYCKGGYHTVKIGDLFNNRYHVVRKLGWGHFSTVWLSWDLMGKRYVALKVVKSAHHYTETAIDEIKLLRAVRESDENDPYREKVVQLLDDFKISGQNGVHVCMVFEVLGHNLLKPIIKSNYMGLPLLTVKVIIKQVLQGLDYLHRKCQIIHTDIKPENILMCVDEEYVRKLAAEATSWVQHGVQPPNSSVSTAPIDKKPQGKMSKNKKKKLKKKQKRQLELIQKQQAQLLELDKPEDAVSTEQDEKGQGDSDITSNTNEDIQEDQEDQEQQIVKEDGCIQEELKEKQTEKEAEEEETIGNSIDNRMSITSEATIEDIDRACDNIEDVEALDTEGINLQEALPVIVNNSNAQSTLDNVVGQEDSTQSKDESETANNNRDEEKSEGLPDIEQTVIPSSMTNGHIDTSTDCVNYQNVNKQNNETTQLIIKNEENESFSRPESELIAKNMVANEEVQELKASQQIQEEALSTESCEKSLQDLQEVPVEQDAQDAPDVQGVQDVQVEQGETKEDEKCSSPDQQPLQVKIADLGNACWVHHHFTEDIQTRQYRALEVLIGAGYSTPADIWSTACMAFELATGDYLFEPHSGENYSRDEDHIAHIMELLGPVPRSIALGGKYSREFFNKRGELRHIHKLKPWDLYHVLVEKYEWSHHEAEELTSFLMPMLDCVPEKRATAAECLLHPWLADVQI
ncbi:SRSF protein kinase 1-like [Glandiceps talaboti]